MLRTPRRRSLVLALVALLVLAPALPALAAPSRAAALPTLLEWLAGWVPWSEPTPARAATAASETFPDWDPNGLEGAPQPAPAGPDATTAQAPPPAGGETLPDWDPNG